MDWGEVGRGTRMKKEGGEEETSGIRHTGKKVEENIKHWSSARGTLPVDRKWRLLLWVQDPASALRGENRAPGTEARKGDGNRDRGGHGSENKDGTGQEDRGRGENWSGNGDESNEEGRGEIQPGNV